MKIPEMANTILKDNKIYGNSQYESWARKDNPPPQERGGGKEGKHETNLPNPCRKYVRRE